MIFDCEIEKKEKKILFLIATQLRRKQKFIFYLRIGEEKHHLAHVAEKINRKRTFNSRQARNLKVIHSRISGELFRKNSVVGIFVALIIARAVHSLMSAVKSLMRHSLAAFHQ